MTATELEQVLDTMTILVDTREQDTERARRRYASFGVSTERAVLDYGDYTWQFGVCGIMYHDTTKRIIPKVAVERKMSLDELAQCFTHDRKRFNAEMIRAKEAGGRIFLLCENSSWENLITGKYRSKFSPSAFIASIVAWSIRYDLQVIFCKEETTGRLIKEILYRDLKERLSNETEKEEARWVHQIMEENAR